MFCENCGKQIPDTAARCAYCGAAIEAIPVQQPASQYQAPQYQTPQYQAPQYQPAAPVQAQPAAQPAQAAPSKKPRPVLRRLGLSFMVLGVTSFLGLLTDGYYTGGGDGGEFFVLGLQALMVIGGALMYSKALKGR